MSGVQQRQIGLPKSRAPRVMQLPQSPLILTPTPLKMIGQPMVNQKPQPLWYDTVGACEDYRAVPFDTVAVGKSAGIGADDVRRTMREKSRATLLRHPDPKR